MLFTNSTHSFDGRYNVLAIARFNCKIRLMQPLARNYCPSASSPVSRRCFEKGSVIIPLHHAHLLIFDVNTVTRVNGRQTRRLCGYKRIDRWANAAAHPIIETRSLLKEVNRWCAEHLLWLSRVWRSLLSGKVPHKEAEGRMHLAVFVVVIKLKQNLQKQDIYRACAHQSRLWGSAVEWFWQGKVPRCLVWEKWSRCILVPRIFPEGIWSWVGRVCGSGGFFGVPIAEVEGEGRAVRGFRPKFQAHHRLLLPCRTHSLFPLLVKHRTGYFSLMHSSAWMEK